MIKNNNYDCYLLCKVQFKIPFKIPGYVSVLEFAWVKECFKNKLERGIIVGCDLLTRE